jgi:hypothetical protein
MIMKTSLAYKPIGERGNPVNTKAMLNPDRPVSSHKACAVRNKKCKVKNDKLNMSGYWKNCLQALPQDYKLNPNGYFLGGYGCKAT